VINSPYYWTISYSKQSLELDLKNDRVKKALYELIEEAEVFIQNFDRGPPSGWMSITKRSPSTMTI
jgi:crotonobetainyl-CoA:carnitine CoA-transferase CaiB-like acyl-CoA transferase